MKRVFRAPALLAALALLPGCAGDLYQSKPLILPQHIKSIMVRPMINKTQFVGLEEKLSLEVYQEFIRDGRLPIVNDEADADGIVEGQIVRYIREPISYDAQNVAEEFKIWVLVNLRFIDRVANTVLWEEPRLEQTYRYFVETRPGGVTEEEAREQLWDLFARDIVKRTIEGFGSVSGASERKISDEVRPAPPAPPPGPFQVPPSPY